MSMSSAPFPTPHRPATLWQQDGDGAHPKSFRAKTNLNKTYNPLQKIKYVWFAQAYSTSAISEDNFSPFTDNVFE